MFGLTKRMYERTDAVLAFTSLIILPIPPEANSRIRPTHRTSVARLTIVPSQI